MLGDASDSRGNRETNEAFVLVLDKSAILRVFHEAIMGAHYDMAGDADT